MKTRTTALALAILGVISISCGKDTPAPTAPDEPAPGIDTPGRTELPTGLAPADVAVSTIGARRPLEDDGSFMARVTGDGESVVAIVDDQDRAVLFGFVDTAEERVVSPESTAEVLLFLALGVATVPGASQSDLLSLIREHAATRTLAEAIATALDDDPLAMTREDASIVDAVASAVDEIAASEIPRAPGAADPSTRESGLLTITPTHEQSGVRVREDAALTETLSIRNRHRRNGYYWVYKTAVDDETGEHDLDPPILVDEGELPIAVDVATPPGGLASITGAFGDVLEWVSREPREVTLPVEIGESRALFECIVAGGHVPDTTPQPPWLSQSTNPNRIDWVGRANRMPAYTVVRDIFLPSLFAVTTPIGLQYTQHNVSYDHAESFLFEVQPWVPDSRAMLAAGQWPELVEALMRTVADDEEGRAWIRGRVRQWTDTGFDISPAGFSFWRALASSRVFYDVFLFGFDRTDVSSVMRHNLAAEQMDRWEIELVTSPLSLRANRSLLWPGRSWSRINAVVRGDYDPSCIRYRVDGPGCLVPLPTDGSDPECPVIPENELVTADRSVALVVPAEDIHGEGSTRVVAELFDTTCGGLNEIDVVGDAAVRIDYREKVVDNCDFDLTPWEQDRHIEVIVDTPFIEPEGTIIARVRNSSAVDLGISVFLPGSALFGRDETEVTGDYAGYYSRPWSGMVFWTRGPDELPLYIPGPREIRLAGVRAGGEVRIVIPTRASIELCPRRGTDPELPRPVVWAGWAVVAKEGVNHAFQRYQVLE